MPIKPRRIAVPAPPQPPSETFSDTAPPMLLTLTSIVIAEPPSRPKRKAATKSTAALQSSTKRKRSSPSITELNESLASVQTCPPTASSFLAPSRNKRRQLIKQTQIQNKSIVSSINKAAAKNLNVQTDYTVHPCSPVQKNQTQYHVSPNYEGP